MNKNGQGFDTFKLLIAAVVAMVILGIVTGVFGKIWAMIGGIQCVSSPVNEIMTTIQKAQTGQIARTQDICLGAGEGLTAENIKNKLSNVASIRFECSQSAAVCSGDSAPLDASDETKLISRRDATFKALVDCTESTEGYKCTVSIINSK